MILLNDDCLFELGLINAESIDAVVTDPPYGLEFMGKGWDHGVPGVEFWQEALRVLKPGGHLLAFGGTRTYHRMTCAIEDAGFEIRDCLMWLYGTGFPKSLDVSKAIDKAAGAENVVGYQPDRWTGKGNVLNFANDRPQAESKITAPATDAAKQWEGWGTALKPAWEPIVLARKLLDGTVARNVLQHGVGGINIDGCRVAGVVPQVTQGAEDRIFGGGKGLRSEPTQSNPHAKGRWPANLILSHSPDCEQVGMREVKTGTAVQRHGGGQAIFGGIAGNEGRLTREDATYGKGGKEEIPAWNCVPGCPIGMLDGQSGHLNPGTTNSPSGGGDVYGLPKGKVGPSYRDGGGGASRFFYCAKASKKERGEGNDHPTVKPIALMQYLVRLITPPGGTVLDPFMGSGTTGMAAREEGFEFVGIEMDEHYFEIAQKRLA